MANFIIPNSIKKPGRFSKSVRFPIINRLYSEIVWMKEEIKIFLLIKAAEIELCLSIVNFQPTQSSGKRFFQMPTIMFQNKVY